MALVLRHSGLTILGMDVGEDLKTISREELKEKIDRKDPFLLVETLAPEKYQQAHLPGAINLPPERLSELAPKLLPDKNALIVVYCASPT
jgi:rhodanese-related sulfurtransferase